MIPHSYQNDKKKNKIYSMHKQEVAFKT